MIDLTQTRLQELLHYDPITGVFTRLVSTSNRANVGDVAGTVNKGDGYRYISVDGHRYAAHRLAWLYTHGHWPVGLLDHADTDGDHNAIHNLRPADHSTNGANRGKNTNNSSGFKGVLAHKRKFRAKIKVNRQIIYLGLHSTPEQAAAAYDAAAITHFGEFATTNRSLGLIA